MIPGALVPYSRGPAERRVKVMLRTPAAAHANMANSARPGVFAFGLVPAYLRSAAPDLGRRFRVISAQTGW
jgi:hypothetical protein